ncbi:unnamed protein product [Prorocentrum cordatum]|uniref:Uncharacterized protein n=1 Tax=Prorocentrum cordatum TaxID=2364126 RepID=A0ABN9YDN1_9DINO|nr:unnamed protein product [Polarella glacialis]
MELGLARDILTYCLEESSQLAQEELRRRQQARARGAPPAVWCPSPERVSSIIGRMAGIAMARRLCEISRAHGGGVRRTLQSLTMSALPDVYVCGGQAERTTLASVDRFVASRGSWESLPPMPTARSFCTAVAVGGRVYVFGGERDQRSAFAAAECFDPASSEWERLPPMPTPRAGCAAAAAGGKIYVCGGLVVAWQVLNVVECFCPATRRWRRVPPMPTPRCGCTAAGQDLSSSAGSWTTVPC